MNFRKLVATGFAITSFTASAAVAADIASVPDPVYGCNPNGFLELHGGVADMDGRDLSEVIAGDASLAICLGSMFGMQLDAKVEHQFDEVSVNGVLHGFIRNPDSYLLGAIAGYGDFGPTDAWFVGPELELYGDQVSFEAVGGYMDVDRGPREGGQVFALADVAFYPTENIRLVAGASTVAKFESAHVGMEWLLSETDLPLSLKLDARYGEDDYVQAMAGITLYFGGDGKSLIRRHREDNVRNRALDINLASGGTTGFGRGSGGSSTGGGGTGGGGTGGGGTGGGGTGGGGTPPGGGGTPPGGGPNEPKPTLEELKEAIGTNCSNSILKALMELVANTPGAEEIYRNDEGLCVPKR